MPRGGVKDSGRVSPAGHLTLRNRTREPRYWRRRAACRVAPVPNTGGTSMPWAAPRKEAFPRDTGGRLRRHLRARGHYRHTAAYEKTGGRRPVAGGVVPGRRDPVGQKKAGGGIRPKPMAGPPGKISIRVTRRPELEAARTRRCGLGTVDDRQPFMIVPWRVPGVSGSCAEMVGWSARWAPDVRRAGVVRRFGALLPSPRRTLQALLPRGLRGRAAHDLVSGLSPALRGICPAGSRHGPGATGL